ncbi:aspartate/glutamate racemase family protein [Bradyrhizobium betae]|uniref:Aspartate/glutamate racemase family protein n=1 Tax=Bradyrhizobium betae TaxID=244734 RepID=A0A4V1P8D6_9BRAD|nr:aspartate/glutamate racemase family protein [Bradyrhizobium betae]RXT54249.1 hypothetical protein B5V03_02070 [Bradyrhizobium betae]
MSREIGKLIIGCASRSKRPETELFFRPSTGISEISEINNLGARFSNDKVILNNILENSRSMDAAIVYCYFDSAAWPARQMLDIPVTGLAESAMTLAALMGRRFAVLSPNRRYICEMEDAIRVYGRRANAIEYHPVRSIGATEMDGVRWLMEGRLDKLVDAVTPVAHACIDDGADVLIVGCGLLSVLLAVGAGIEEIDGVPVVAPVTAAVKAAEILIDLRRSGMPIKGTQGYWGNS